MKDPKKVIITLARLGQIGELIAGYERQIRTLQREIDDNKQKIADISDEEKFLRSVFLPNITINEVRNRQYGMMYIGKFRFYLDPKPQLITIYIGKSDRFTGMSDPNLLKVASEKAFIAVSKALEKNGLAFPSKLSQ
jgi:hypothetical protein